MRSRTDLSMAAGQVVAKAEHVSASLAAELICLETSNLDYSPPLILGVPRRWTNFSASFLTPTILQSPNIGETTKKMAVTRPGEVLRCIIALLFRSYEGNEVERSIF